MFNTRFASFAFFVFALPILLLTGCGGGSSSTSATPVDTNSTTSTRTYNDLQFTLSTTKATFRGEQVPLTFTVKNIGSQTISATGGGCNVLLRVLQGTQIIGPEPASCGAGGYTSTLNSGESKTYTTMWSQKDVNGNQVASGIYTLRVWTTAGNINGSDLTADQTETNLSASIQVTVSS